MCERNVLLKTLNHPFLVRLHFSFQTKERLCLVLDYAGGGEVCMHTCKHTMHVSLIVFTETKCFMMMLMFTYAYVHSSSTTSKKNVCSRSPEPDFMLQK